METETKWRATQHRSKFLNGLNIPVNTDFSVNYRLKSVEGIWYEDFLMFNYINNFLFPTRKVHWLRT